MFYVLCYALMKKTDSNTIKYLLSQKGNAVDKTTHEILIKTEMLHLVFVQYLVFYKKTRLKVAQQKPSSLPRFSQTSRIPPYLQNPDQSTKYIALAYRHAIYLVILHRFLIIPFNLSEFINLIYFSV